MILKQPLPRPSLSFLLFYVVTTSMGYRQPHHGAAGRHEFLKLERAWTGEPSRVDLSAEFNPLYLPWNGLPVRDKVDQF